MVIPRGDQLTDPTNERDDQSKIAIRAAVEGTTSTPPTTSEELSSFEVTETISRVDDSAEAEAAHRVLAFRVHTPAVYGVVRQIEFSTPLRDWLLQRVKSIMGGVSDDLADAIVSQATIEYEHDLMTLLAGSVDVLRYIAHFKALIALSDPKRAGNWRAEYGSVEPISERAFDTCADAREERKKLKKKFDALVDSIIPVGKGRAPDILPGAARAIEEEVRMDYRQRMAEEIRRTGSASGARIIQEMSLARQYGRPPRTLGASAIDHIIHPRNPTPPSSSARRPKRKRGRRSLPQE